MKRYTVEDLWLVVLRRDNGDESASIWAAPADRTGLRRIFRSATPGRFPVSAVPVAQVFAAHLQAQPGALQRALRGRWFVAIVQGAEDVPQVVQVQAKSPHMAASALRDNNQELRALLSQEDVRAATAVARAIISGESPPDRDLVANPPAHGSTASPGELEKIEYRDRNDVWSKVRK